MYDSEAETRIVLKEEQESFQHDFRIKSLAKLGYCNEICSIAQIWKKTFTSSVNNLVQFVISFSYEQYSYNVLA